MIKDTYLQSNYSMENNQNEEIKDGGKIIMLKQNDDQLSIIKNETKKIKPERPYLMMPCKPNDYMSTYYTMQPETTPPTLPIEEEQYDPYYSYMSPQPSNDTENLSPMSTESVVTPRTLEEFGNLAELMITNGELSDFMMDTPTAASIETSRPESTTTESMLSPIRLKFPSFVASADVKSSFWSGRRRSVSYVTSQQPSPTAPPTNPMMPPTIKRRRHHSFDITALQNCQVEGCKKKKQGNYYCIKHGGGKRCIVEGCTKSIQSNQRCKAHGGGPRCEVLGCTKSSQGHGKCRRHGGGKRCYAIGCTKSAQWGNYCASHGGSKICEIPGCMKRARSQSLCAEHGGGKRCIIEKCSRPARKGNKCTIHYKEEMEQFKIEEAMMKDNERNTF